MLFILVILFIVLVFPKNAYAYVDPGSGSYLIQIILGFFLAGGFFLKDRIRKGINKVKELINSNLLRNVKARK